MSELKTINEMAKLFKVSARTFRTYVNEYNLPFYEMGRQKMFDEREVLAKLKTFGVKQDSPIAKPKKKSSGLGIVTDKEKEFARNLGFNV